MSCADRKEREWQLGLCHKWCADVLSRLWRSGARGSRHGGDGGSLGVALVYVQTPDELLSDQTDTSGASIKHYVAPLPSTWVVRTTYSHMSIPIGEKTGLASTRICTVSISSFGIGSTHLCTEIRR